VAPILKIRDQISTEFGNDPSRYLSYLMEYQKQFANRLVSYADGDTEKAEGEPSA
jgi:hypothetical protein